MFRRYISFTKKGTHIFQKINLNVYLHNDIRVVDSNLMKNAQTCAEIPANQNLPQIPKYEFSKCKEQGQIQTLHRLPPFSHDTRYVTSLHHSNYNYIINIIITFEGKFIKLQPMCQ